MRQGGVLYVLVKRASNLPRKPFFKGRFLRRRTALHVIAAGQEKKSRSVKGADPHFTQPLVFLLGAPPSRGERPGAAPPRGLACWHACQGGGARPTPAACLLCRMLARAPVPELAHADGDMQSLTCSVACEAWRRML